MLEKDIPEVLVLAMLGKMPPISCILSHSSKTLISVDATGSISIVLVPLSAEYSPWLALSSGFRSSPTSFKKLIILINTVVESIHFDAVLLIPRLSGF